MMNGRHLPVGQGMQQDMGRRRSYNHQQYQPVTPIYNGYIHPYNNYYPQAPPQYQHGSIPPAQYSPYPSYGRSPPPPFQQYANTPSPPVVSSYPRSLPHSPAVVSSPYQPPQQQLPASLQPSHPMPSPMIGLATESQPAKIVRPVFQPPLPWLSRPDLPWPKRSIKTRRPRKTLQACAEAVELPTIQSTQIPQNPPIQAGVSSDTATHIETPSTTQPPSEEAASTTPTTPSSLQQASNVPATPPTPTQAKHSPKHPAAIPIVPVVPISVSRVSPATVAPESKSPETVEPKSLAAESIHHSNADAILPPASDTQISEVQKDAPLEDVEIGTTLASTKAPPKLWTGLFKAPTVIPTIATNAVQSKPSILKSKTIFSKSNSESVADVLSTFSASTRDAKLAFIKPRGLVNTGNMCYMNSVLQVLIYCMPFYNFLDEVGKRGAHSFKSDTPLIDAMIMFIREFPVIDSAASLEQLRMRLKENELEEYGEAFTPDFVYEVIRRLPRFSTMRRGHQQDAEEFLGFLLEGLHDECVLVMQSSGGSNGSSSMVTPTNVPSSPASDVPSMTGSASGEALTGWLEVGPKQKPAITRSSGAIVLESPVTKIFGGSLRSELRVPGLKNSVTMERYQPLQLDIGSPQVNNIIDALKGLTRAETLHGDFKSPRGPNVTATKQVLIETLPPILILHLKRFQYDNTGGTQKIWKKIGYPLELEIPKEVFPRQKQAGMLNHGGLPRYRLMAVVYHHGKNASGGHYTVDVRRQDGQEWIRLDDTVIRRIRSEDVAEGGSEEDPKVLAAALEAHKNDSPTSSNIFAQMNIDEDEETGTGEGWKQVNGTSSSTSGGSNKKWSSVLNGNTTPKTKNGKSSIKDNKVAYLLFYQKITI